LAGYLLGKNLQNEKVTVRGVEMRDCNFRWKRPEKNQKDQKDSKKPYF